MVLKEKKNYSQKDKKYKQIENFNESNRILQKKVNMIKVPIPKDEEERLESLYSYQILDTGEEEKFDEITKATATFLEADMAFICFVDKDRQWFKSSYSIDIKEGPRDISICGHAIMSNDLFITKNLKKDKRFHDMTSSICKTCEEYKN